MDVQQNDDTIRVRVHRTHHLNDATEFFRIFFLETSKKDESAATTEDQAISCQRNKLERKMGLWINIFFLLANNFGMAECQRMAGR